MKLHRFLFALAFAASGVLTAIILLLSAPHGAVKPALGQYPQPPYTIDQLTPAVIAGAAAAITALIFRYVPGAAAWFDTLRPVHKQWFMLGVTAFYGAAIGIWNMAVDGFTQESLLQLLIAIFASLASNQVAYQFIKKQP